jgi:transposase
MKIPQVLIGVDIAAESFTLTSHDTISKSYSPSELFQSDPEGLEKLQSYLDKHGMTPSNTAFCMEATGVYVEPLAYFLAAKKYVLAIEAPHRAKRAFYPLGGKSDPLDSRQLAEYAFRFFDQLPFWNPSDVIVEQIRVLLSIREQLSRQSTASKNALAAIRHKVIHTLPAEEALESVITTLKEQIKKIDQEIKNRTTGHPTFGPTVALIMSVPGVGLLLAANLLTLSNGFTKPLDSRSIASHLGICPLPYQSGTSIFRRSRSRGGGPSILRKLLYLAAMNLRTFNPGFKKYFLRKKDQGKKGALVINNIENRLLKIICAVIRTQTAYIVDYHSVNPMFLKKVA